VALDFLSFYSQAIWFEGNCAGHVENRLRRLGEHADRPHRIRYKMLMG
jgi:hypothetical protein